jgi:hypothetical protein
MGEGRAGRGPGSPESGNLPVIIVKVGDRQVRVTGGRWRRIVLGGVLAEHVVELRGRARVWPYVGS